MTTASYEGLGRGISAPRGSRLLRPSSASRPVAGFAPASGAQLTGGDAGGDAAADGTVSVPWWSGAASAISQLNPGLVLVGRRLRVSDSAFTLASIVALTFTLISLLILNTALTTDSFRLQELRIQNSKLTITEQELLGQLSDAQAPIGLEQRARELGMVPAANPVFLSLANGKVLGVEDPALPPPAPAKPKRPGAGADGFPQATNGPGGESAALPLGGVLAAGASAAGEVSTAGPAGLGSAALAGLPAAPAQPGAPVANPAAPVAQPGRPGTGVGGVSGAVAVSSELDSFRGGSSSGLVAGGVSTGGVSR